MQHAPHTTLNTFLSNESLQYLVNPSKENALAHNKHLKECTKHVESCLNHIDLIIISPITLNDNKVSDEHLSSSMPEILINKHPTSLKTKEDKHIDTHTACKVEAQNNAMQTSSDFGDATGHPCTIPATFTLVLNSPKAARPQAIPKGLAPSQDCTHSSCTYHTQFLHYVTCSHAFASMDKSNDKSDDDSHLSGWDSNDDEEYSALWPSLLTTPIQGDDMHPPQLTICRQHPGQGWMVNTIGTTHYYRLLIRDPSTDKNIVAPFILYVIN